MKKQLLTCSETRQNLFKKYTELNVCEKVLVQAISMLQYIRRSDLYAFLGSINLIEYRFDNLDWKAAFNECVRLQLLEVAYSDNYQVNKLMIMLCLEDAYQNINSKNLEAAANAWRRSGYSYWSDDYLSLIQIRIAFVTGISKTFIEWCSYSSFTPTSTIVWWEFFDNPFNERYLAAFPDSDQVLILKIIIRDALLRCDNFDQAYNYAMRIVQTNKDQRFFLQDTLALSYLLKGQFDLFHNAINHGNISRETMAVFEAIRGDNDLALELFESSLKNYRKETHRNSYMFEGIAASFYILCLLRSNDQKNRAKAFKYANQALRKMQNNNNGYYSIHPFTALFDEHGLLFSGKIEHTSKFTLNDFDIFNCWIRLLIIYWRCNTLTDAELDECREVYALVKRNGYEWLASEIAQLLYMFSKDAILLSAIIPQSDNWPCVSFVNVLPIEQPWERALNSLGAIISSDNSSAGTENKNRLCWRLTLDDNSYRSVSLQLIEQKKLKNGQWNVGKEINIYRLSNSHPELIISEQDSNVIRMLLSNQFNYNPDSAYSAIAALANHPAVYSTDKPDQRIEIVKEQPRMVVLPNSNGYKILFDPWIPPEHQSRFIFKIETRERIVVFELKPEHIHISATIGKDGLQVPPEGKDRLLNTINTIAPQLTIHADIDDTIQTSEMVEPDCRPVLRLSGDRQSLFIETLVRPINGGKLFSPGHGTDTVYETIDGKRVHSHRKLTEEISALKKVLKLCPTLGSYIDDHQFSNTIENPIECLEILSECKSVESTATVLWKESKPIVVDSVSAGKNASIKVTPSGDWFSLDGQIKIDENQTISFGALLKLLDSSDGRFVRLDDNRYLALTKEFKSQLSRLQSFSTPNGLGMKMHSLAAIALGNSIEKIDGIELCKEWKSRVKQMHSILEQSFEIPSTFQGTLRDYQIEGFLWLARLAGLGAGACLADDMGLGKTIQAIALLLHRAADGPALIIAPTSVCKNWYDEINRFAPSLDVQMFGESDRQKCIDDSAAGSAIICSYGLLNTCSELLTAKEWNSIIIDEAQAIKNMATQRSKAVMDLKGRFKMVATGTPIENHLGELWNIFRFINNGLLGTIEEFNRRFASPIQIHQNSECRQRLKTLINPFVLRRLKSEVLDELPPRTEKIIYVEPNKEEIALYESLRRKALDDLENSDGLGKHIRILAHIMKLRRACCHPSLVLPDVTIPGSKIDAFAECVTELIENKHKALVFSQFTDHLEIIKNYCDSQNISYEYLDGSTPAAQRARSIKAFQCGEMPLFLMSLKAGGVGVNLTAADYVILLDPWWNPAVEDQAAARAHRMGQIRPVTVYRLITKGTIEEKIIELHKHKRDLAESLLDGGDLSGKMSAEELMKLIRDCAE